MPDKEFGQYKQSYRRKYEQQLARRKLEALLKSAVGGSMFDSLGYQPKDSLGIVRDFLASSDTSAYPPHVLNVPVYRSSDLGAQPKYGTFTVADYHPNRDKIRLLDDLEYVTAHSGRPADPYGALLHEAGHARGYSQIPHIPLNMILDSEKKIRRAYALFDSMRGEDYAQTLADSLMRR